MQNLGTVNIISRRDIEPLLFKAGGILSAYEKASDCIVSVIDPGGNIVEPEKTKKVADFCDCCKEHLHCSGHELGTGEFSCVSMHQKGIEESRKLGGSYIYMCPLGFVFWISPLYSGGRYAGALSAGMVLGIEREEARKRIQSYCADTAMGNQFMSDLELIPQRNYEEIKALAQMMLICAQQISADFGAAGSTGSAGFGGSDTVYVTRTPHEVPAKRSVSLNERFLIAALRRGDSATAKRILEEILNSLAMVCPGHLRFFQCKAIELVVLLSRSCATDNESSALLEANNVYLKKISDSLTVEELSANLYRIIERMAGKIFSFQGLRHASALRKAERFIWKNYTRKVSLEEIASASGLSAPYFSTIFREEMGEYLSTYLNRLRVEKACTMLIETNATLNEVSESCGFEDQSWFSKIFKSYTGHSPGKFREQGGINAYPEDKDYAG